MSSASASRPSPKTACRRNTSAVESIHDDFPLRSSPRLLICTGLPLIIGGFLWRAYRSVPKVIARETLEPQMKRLRRKRGPLDALPVGPGKRLASLQGRDCLRSGDFPCGFLVRAVSLRP